MFNELQNAGINIYLFYTNDSLSGALEDPANNRNPQHSKLPSTKPGRNLSRERELRPLKQGLSQKLHVRVYVALCIVYYK